MRLQTNYIWNVVQWTSMGNNCALLMQICFYGSFMFLFCLVFAMFCARLFICALWSPAGKGLTSLLSFVVSSVSLSLSHWYPGSGVVLDCIDSWSLQPYLLYFVMGETSCCLFLTIIRQMLLKRSNRKWGWSGNTTITNFRPTQGTERKSHRTFTATRHPKDNKSKATSSHFLFVFT